MRSLWSSCCVGLMLTSFAACGCNSLATSNRGQAAYEETQRQLAAGAVRPVSYEETPEAYETDEGLLGALAPENLSDQILAATGQGPNPEVAKQHFAEAQRLYQEAVQAEGDARITGFKAAAGRYVKAAKRWPKSALQQDSLYWAGQSYFFADMYPEANQQFEVLLKKYPNSKYLDPVEARRFSIAMYWLALDENDPESVFSVNVTDKMRPWRDTYGHATRILNRIRLDDPRGKLADDATLAAGNAYFRSGDYLKSDEYYTDLRTSFPSSEHQFTAHLLGMQSKLRSYMGPDYSGNPLTEAEKLIEQMRKQFPNESAKNRELLAKSYAKVRLSKAERKWARAAYRDWRHEYRAARMFYQEIVEEFADTPYAERAQARITEIASLPAVPPTRFGWLVNAFPTEEPKPLMSTTPLDALRR